MSKELLAVDNSVLFLEIWKRREFSFITKSERGLHQKQQEAFKILTDYTTVEFCYGGAAGGAKSWTGCAWILFMSLQYPGIKSFIARDELKKLRETTLITFYKVCREYGIKPGKDFNYNGQDHFILFTNGSRIDLIEVGYKPSDPLYERFGSSEYTIGWIEEASETNFGAFDTLKSRVGRHLNDKYKIKRKIFNTCNPKNGWVKTYYFTPAKKGELRSDQKFLQALVGDNPFRESDYVSALESITDKAKKERLLFGNWDYDDDPSVLMGFDVINDCFSSDYVKPGNRYLTIDVARYGDDSTVIIRWNGYRAEEVIQINHERSISKPGAIVAINEKIKELQSKYMIPKSQTIADEDGVGGGVVDMNGCHGFINNSSPISMGDFENYSNLRSQCYFLLSNLVNNNGMYVFTSDTDIRTKITEELSVIKDKNFDSDEKKKAIISREEIKQLIGRSPDFASALMMRMYFDLNKPIQGATYSRR